MLPETMSRTAQKSENVGLTCCSEIGADLPMHDIFYELDRINAEVHFDGANLKISAHRGTLTDELKGKISRHKNEILSFLRDSGHTGKVSAMALVVRPDRIPLSFAQERLWLLEQLGLVKSAYNVPVAVRLQGMLDVAALTRGFGEVMRRHEILRTRFA